VPEPTWLRANGRIILVLLGVAAMASPSRAGSSARRTPAVEAVRMVQPSVVSISSEKRAASSARWPFSAEENQRPRVSGMGTGVVIDERGYILTNQHVVDKVQGIEVLLADGSRYAGRVVQQDPVMDIALLKIDAGRPVPAIKLGSSADLMVGEDVITIGNAFGYENTVSVGIISALGRNVTLSDEQVYRNLIQTDACINPGNSGGPLVNIDGELIGINVAVRAGAQGIGFALPIDDVKRVAVEMMSTRRLAATWHGIQAAESRKGADRVVVVSAVQAGSPAEAAGVRPGDRLRKVGDLEIISTLDVERGLLDLRPGQKTDLLVVRGGEEKELPLEMQPLPGAATAAAPAAGRDDVVWRTLGLKTMPVSREYVAVVSNEWRGGLFVQAVMPGSPADRALIQKGDILVGLNAADRDWETIRPDNVAYVLNLPEVGRAGTLQFYLVRRNGFVQGSLSLAGAPQATARR
jgi:serine protease Do